MFLMSIKIRLSMYYFRESAWETSGDRASWNGAD